jgi:reactive intermediate/imine deaminase
MRADRDDPFLTTLEELVTKKIISTDKAPKAIGPYSQAVQVGSTVYLSGQIPLDPLTGDIVSGDIDAEARRVLDNLTAVAEAAGGTLAHVVRLTIYLTDLSTFQTVNQLMKGYFSEPYPARATIGVSQLPRGARVEIDAILELSA